jgi:Spy/CpxP family protein refolding chaperone
MNTLNKRAGVLLTGLFLLAGAGLFAEPMGDDGPGFGSGPRGDEGKTEGRFEEMNKELGLTKEQAEKLRAHRRSQRETNQALWKQMEEKREALRAELEKPKVDSGKAKSINEELKALHNKMAEQPVGRGLASAGNPHRGTVQKTPGDRREAPGWWRGAALPTPPGT